MQRRRAPSDVQPHRFLHSRFSSTDGSDKCHAHLTHLGILSIVAVGAATDTQYSPRSLSRAIRQERTFLPVQTPSAPGSPVIVAVAGRQDSVDTRTLIFDECSRFCLFEGFCPIGLRSTSLRKPRFAWMPRCTRYGDMCGGITLLSLRDNKGYRNAFA